MVYYNFVWPKTCYVTQTLEIKLVPSRKCDVTTTYQRRLWGCRIRLIFTCRLHESVDSCGRRITFCATLTLATSWTRRQLTSRVTSECDVEIPWKCRQLETSQYLTCHTCPWLRNEHDIDTSPCDVTNTTQYVTVMSHGDVSVSCSDGNSTWYKLGIVTSHRVYYTQPYNIVEPMISWCLGGQQFTIVSCPRWQTTIG